MKESDRTTTGGHSTLCDEVPPGLLLYTKPQMAAVLQVSLRCLSDMMRRGDISYLKINRRMVRFRPEDVVRRLCETSLVCHAAERKEDA